MNPYKARINVREFLNLPGFHDGAYIVAYVEDTSERSAKVEHSWQCDADDDPGEKCTCTPELENPHPRFILEIADCNNKVDFSFEIYNALNRTNSFNKIDTLIAALNQFRQGLVEECQVRKQRDKEIEILNKAKKGSQN